MRISECPQCGATCSPGDRKCGYCKAEFFVNSLAYLGGFDATSVGKYLSHFNKMMKEDAGGVAGPLGLGLCYLQSGMHPMAQKCFERVIEMAPDVPQSYYYHSLATIRGRRLRTISLDEVRSIEANLNTAIMIDDRQPQYKLLLAMLKRDYYAANGMKASPPSYESLIAAIDGQPVNHSELERLRQTVKVGNTNDFFSNIVAI